MDLFYILPKVGEPIPEPDLDKWERWFSDFSNRCLAKDSVGAVQVTTVFFGCVEAEPVTGKPIFFGTLVCWSERKRDEFLYETRAEALAGHHKIIKVIKSQRSRIKMRE
jgi:hypothetical protein